LDRGLYDSVADGINDVVAEAFRGPKRGGARSILDAGCGEGFYLKRLKDSLASGPETASGIEYYGVDISKVGVRQATRRDKTMHWFVASIVDLPFAAGSLDIILNVFSLADFAEFSRVLGASGKLVIASPGPRHLNGLREIIYPVAREHAGSTRAEQARGLFSLADERRIHYQLELRSNQEIMDLLAMTPYYWNIDLNTKSKVEALDRLALDVDVLISVFNKTA
jgi:23S rRNA (guanine745-N1)-methyltransferase